jgi:hypothetical protein
MYTSVLFGRRYSRSAVGGDVSAAASIVAVSCKCCCHSAWKPLHYKYTRTISAVEADFMLLLYLRQLLYAARFEIAPLHIHVHKELDDSCDLSVRTGN